MVCECVIIEIGLSHIFPNLLRESKDGRRSKSGIGEQIARAGCSVDGTEGRRGEIPVS